jgi:16S rRNA A1518/A1519 N6-dimethyltransferase RsmA/KsgA/DIM1 with predicted DNA glycosylase/AP lyase activity
MKKIKTEKKFGSTFFQDGNIIRQIADSIPVDRDDLVIEIGPGTGMLTRELLKRYSNIRAVEIDGRAVDYLKKKFPDLDLCHEDILKLPGMSYDRYRNKRSILLEICLILLHHRFYLSTRVQKKS